MINKGVYSPDGVGSFPLLGFSVYLHSRRNNFPNLTYKSLCYIYILNRVGFTLLLFYYSGEIVQT